jgi:hypothetical protein
MEARFDRIESMLSQLINNVGNLNSNLQEIKVEQQDMKSKLYEMEHKNEERHIFVVEQVKVLKVDQDVISEKATRNEREFENYRRTHG